MEFKDFSTFKISLIFSSIWERRTLSSLKSWTTEEESPKSSFRLFSSLSKLFLSWNLFHNQNILNRNICLPPPNLFPTDWIFSWGDLFHFAALGWQNQFYLPEILTRKMLILRYNGHWRESEKELLSRCWVLCFALIYLLILQMEDEEGDRGQQMFLEALRTRSHLLNREKEK